MAARHSVNYVEYLAHLSYFACPGLKAHYVYAPVEYIDVRCCGGYTRTCSVYVE